ncbi:MAG: hypothetical protein ACRELC_13790, partial [Gemmatimonadota bacterium]
MIRRVAIFLCLAASAACFRLPPPEGVPDAAAPPAPPSPSAAPPPPPSSATAAPGDGAVAREESP